MAPRAPRSAGVRGALARGCERSLTGTEPANAALTVKPYAWSFPARASRSRELAVQRRAQRQGAVADTAARAHRGVVGRRLMRPAVEPALGVVDAGAADGVLGGGGL